MADDKTQIPSLYKLTIEVVLQQHIKEKNDNFDPRKLPDRIIHDLIRECLLYGPRSGNSNGSEKPVRKYSTRKLRTFFNKITLCLWVRLLKYEAYRQTLIHFYQRLYNYDCKESVKKEDVKVDEFIVKSFQELTFEDVGTASESNLLKHINYGLNLGSFFSEGSWYEVSEGILSYTKHLCDKLPENHVSTYLLRIECCQRLFRTLYMFFKFDNAAIIFDEIEILRECLKQCKEQVNYTLLFTEYSRYNFLKNNYEESHKWIQRAMSQLHDKVPVSVVIKLLNQASRVCVVKRDFKKAKYLIYQALGRAYQYYGPENYKLAALLLDFGFYLLNSDQIEQSVIVYQEVYSLNKKMFDNHSNNLLVALTEEDLAYALYVQEYSSGFFDSAMKYAKQAIGTMEKLLPPDNLMLSSANRVKALILEEMAIDTYTNQGELVNMDMLEEAEKLHKDALRLTKHTFGEENILTAKHYGNLGRLYQSMRKYEEAEKMHLKAIQIKERILGADDYEVGLSVGHLASLYNYHMHKYKQAEELYLRSIHINLKLFSESYSGLEYDYRGLIHVYEHLSDTEQYLKFSNKLHKWTALRNTYASESISSNFYENIRIDPLNAVLYIYTENQEAESSRY